MNREDAMKRIRKCMALARSASGPEAAAALRQAQALMREHQVDEAGMALAAVNEKDARTLFKPLLGWEVELVICVADAFGCEVISTTCRDAREVAEFELHVSPHPRRYWRLIGVDAGPEVAAYAFEVLGAQCVKARRTHMAAQSKNCKASTRTARGDAFATGWVRAVQALVENFATGARDAELLKAYMDKAYPSLGRAHVKHRDKGRNVRESAHHGHQAGKRAQLHHGVGKMPERLALGL